MEISRSVTLHKMEGETPLFCMQRFQQAFPEYQNVPMTYAGRLDPMASGVLLCLVGEECKKKDEYLKFDKEYMFEMLVGFHTDAFDILGIVDDMLPVENSSERQREILFGGRLEASLSKMTGKFEQAYPPFSSRTVGGKALHELAKSGQLPECRSYPTSEVTVYDIAVVSKKEILCHELLENVVCRIGKVKGDFRQSQIIEKWEQSLDRYPVDFKFNIIKCKVSCSSGTYVRGLADQISKQLKVPLCIFSIERKSILP